MGVRRLPGRPDGYGMTDNGLEKTLYAMFQKEREMDAAPERERAPTVQSVTNIHVHGGQVGNLVTGGLVHGGASHQTTRVVLLAGRLTLLWRGAQYILVTYTGPSRAACAMMIISVRYICAGPC